MADYLTRFAAISFYDGVHLHFVGSSRSCSGELIQSSLIFLLPGFVGSKGFGTSSFVKFRSYSSDSRRDGDDKEVSIYSGCGALSPCKISWYTKPVASLSRSSIEFQHHGSTQAFGADEIHPQHHAKSTDGDKNRWDRWTILISCLLG